jgi:hypothetical protein
MPEPGTAHQIAGYPELSRYRVAAAEWIDGHATDEDELRAAGSALCALALGHHVPAEQLLIAIRGAAQPAVIEGTSPEALRSIARWRRDKSAVGILMQCYYA